MNRKFKRTGTFYTYILECIDGTLYTGYTNNLKKRLKLHNNGAGAKYVKLKRPAKVVFYKKYKYFKSAFKAERTIKKFTRRQKLDLIAAEGILEDSINS